MQILRPKAEMFLLPEDTVRINIAEHQDYQTLPSLVTPDGRVVSQWQPDVNDLLLLNNGVPVTLVLHTFNRPMQPVQLAVGGLDLR
jgi:hypothetical protein